MGEAGAKLQPEENAAPASQDIAERMYLVRLPEETLNMFARKEQL